jgi:hypothetical protein
LASFAEFRHQLRRLPAIIAATSLDAPRERRRYPEAKAKKIIPKRRADPALSLVHLQMKLRKSATEKAHDSLPHPLGGDVNLQVVRIADEPVA